MFYNVDRRFIIGVVAVLFVIFLLHSGPEYIMEILLTLPCVILCIDVHEFSHALAADKLGDKTPRSEGRLTLNPLKHLDPVGLVLLTFARIGWGKPVHVNVRNCNSNRSYGECEAIIAFAGPLSNFIFAFVLSIVLVIVTNFAFFFENAVGNIIYRMMSYTFLINVGLGVFNLIPIPPLDGEKIFRNMLPQRAQEFLLNYGSYFQVLFMILWFTGYLGAITVPAVEFLASKLLALSGFIVGFFIH